MKLSRRFIALPVLLLGFIPALAGSSKFSVSGSLKLSSAYVWRGGQVCGLHLNPCVAFHYGNLCLEQYSFLSLDGNYREIDWDLSYTIGPVTLHLADYYWHGPGHSKEGNYFSWAKGTTHHVDEVVVVYSSGAIPFRASWFTFFWGDWLPAGVPGEGRLSLSSYLQLEGWYDFGKYGTLSAVFGASVLKGSYTGYTKDFMPVHLALAYSKSFDFASFSIPLELSFVLNPYNGACLPSASVGIRF